MSDCSTRRRGRSILLLVASLGTAGWLGAGIAEAENVQNVGPTAGHALRQLQDWGYHVMLNGLARDVAYLDDQHKAQCLVTAIHPVVTGPVKPGEFQTVYVNLSCPSDEGSDTDQ